MRAAQKWDYWLPTEEVSPLPLPGGFDELFEAAKVLLKENAPESQIIPTLALANHLSHGVPRLLIEKDRFMRLKEDERAWETEADRFARRFGGLRPLRIAHGILILERRPVLVAVGHALVRKGPEDVIVTAYPHRTPLATPEEVAADYSRALSDAGLACDERRTGHVSYAFFNRRLEISIRPGTVTERATIVDGATVPQPGYRSDESTFPHPDFVGAFCTALVKTASAGGHAADLPTRSRGAPPKAENLIPACVAFLLKEYGIQPDKEINGLLDTYVLDDGWKSGHSERSLFVQALKGTSLHQQVWDNSRKRPMVRDPLIDAAWTLFWEGYEE